MELEIIVSLIEEALEGSFEPGVESIRTGDIEHGLANLEQSYAKIATALDALRSFHCPPHSGVGVIT